MSALVFLALGVVLALFLREESRGSMRVPNNPGLPRSVTKSEGLPDGGVGAKAGLATTFLIISEPPLTMLVPPWTRLWTFG